MNERERAILKTAARDLILDSLVDSGDPLDSVPDAKLASLFDEVMAYRPPMEKKAAYVPTPEDRTEERVAELAELGRIAAQSYAKAYLAGVEKIALNLEALKTRIKGISPEEEMARSRAQREMELELVPRESEMKERAQDVAEHGQVHKDVDRMREMQMKDYAEQQALAEQLRRLQLGDQHARRVREAQLFQELHGKEPWGKIKSMVGGGLLGFAGRRALMGAAAAGVPTAMALAPLAGKMTGVGAALGLGAHLLGADKPGRSITRLERERYAPASITGDVTL